MLWTDIVFMKSYAKPCEIMPKMAHYKIRINGKVREIIYLPYEMTADRRSKERKLAAVKYNAPLHYIRLHRALNKVDRRKFGNNLKTRYNFKKIFDGCKGVL